MKIALAYCMIFSTFMCNPVHATASSVIADASKAENAFRDYQDGALDSVKEFYREHHRSQTYKFVGQKIDQYSKLNNMKMSVWDAMQALDTIVDESDPDLHAPQSLHSYQTAEALRKDGHPRWLILVGLIHDLGKVLLLYGEPQWAVVGDTFPVGCAYSEKVIFPAYFAENPDREHVFYRTQYGVYQPHCGLANVRMAW